MRRREWEVHSPIGPLPFPCVCGAGEFHAVGGCAPCPKGEFQPEIGRTECLICPKGTTTAGSAATDLMDCYPTCPVGFFLDSASRMCEPCGLRGYQPEEGMDRCISCPPGTAPLYLNSTSVDHCLENCHPGWHRSPDGLHCLPCPVGSFKSPLDAVCLLCPQGMTTLNEAADSLDNCNIHSCSAGSFYSLESHSCQPCSFGYYQDEQDARECKKCPEGMTTYTIGASSSSVCQSTNQCQSGQNDCHWLAACIDLPDEQHQPRYSCKCKPGFVGNGITCSDACAGYCTNKSTCIKTARGDVKCICEKGFKGRRCEVTA